jgi:uncharacterized membrane protein YvlD (DUF360 family)
MKVFLSIVINALILYAITMLLAWNEAKWVVDWVVATGWWKTYMLWWIILWLLNITIRPFLKILSIPFFLFFFWLTVFIVNWVILKLFTYILNDVLQISWMTYSIVWVLNFIIAVAIFTFLNMIYSLLFFKK